MREVKHKPYNGFSRREREWGDSIRRKYGLLLLLLLFLTPTNADISSDLILRMPLNVNSSDLSGSGNDYTNFGVSLGSPGGDFEATDGDKLLITSGGYDMLTQYDAFSLCFNDTQETTTSQQGIYYERDGAGNGFGLLVSNAGLPSYRYQMHYAGGVGLYSSTVISTTPHRVCFAYEGDASKRAVLIVDGVTEANVTLSQAINTQSQYSSRWGMVENTANLDGIIGNVCGWSVANYTNIAYYMATGDCLPEEEEAPAPSVSLACNSYPSGEVVVQDFVTLNYSGQVLNTNLTGFTCLLYVKGDYNDTLSLNLNISDSFEWNVPFDVATYNWSMSCNNSALSTSCFFGSADMDTTRVKTYTLTQSFYTWALHLFAMYALILLFFGTLALAIFAPIRINIHRKILFYMNIASAMLIAFEINSAHPWGAVTNLLAELIFIAYALVSGYFSILISYKK